MRGRRRASSGRVAVLSAGGAGGGGARAALEWSGAVAQAVRGGGCGPAFERRRVVVRDAVVAARAGGVQASAGANRRRWREGNRWN